MKKMFPVFALGALMMFVASCEKDTEFENKEEPGTENADTFLVEAVDLGLSVKWASHNVGAKSPEDYGGYYAWGETEEKSDYSWDTYKYNFGDDLDDDGYIESNEYRNIGSDISGTSYDVAHVKWGGSWRMPTSDEIAELCNKCSWEWTTINGVNGQKVTGPNGNSIFLPAAGIRLDTEVNGRGSVGNYWSSSLGVITTLGSDCLMFIDNSDFVIGCYLLPREGGLPVRPVTD